MDRRVVTIISLIDAGFHQHLSQHDLAKSVNLSRYYLCHLFKRETGLSLLEYLRAVRMGRAKHLLETTFLSVKQITTIVGFGDESHFVRDFKARYGLSPVAHRARFASKADSTPSPPLANLPANEIDEHLVIVGSDQDLSGVSIPVDHDKPTGG